MDIHIVTYAFAPDTGEYCFECGEPAVVKIDVTPAHLVTFGCLDHAADHMRGNADAIDTRDPAEIYG